MFIRRAFALVLAILLLWPVGLYAQSKALKEADNQAIALFKAGKYEQAIPFWRKSLELSEKEFGPSSPTTAAVLDALAQTYHRQGLYTEAAPLYQRSLDMFKKAYGPDNRHVATVREHFAALLRETVQSVVAKEMKAQMKKARAKEAARSSAPIESAIVGTWQSEPVLGQLGLNQVTLTFNEDGSVTSKADFISFPSFKADLEYFWLVSKGTYSIDGNEVTSNFGGTWAVQKMRGNDETVGPKKGKKSTQVFRLKDGKLFTKNMELTRLK